MSRQVLEHLLPYNRIQEWLTPHALENTLAENAAANGGRAAIEADDSTSMTDVTREFSHNCVED